MRLGHVMTWTRGQSVSETRTRAAMTSFYLRAITRSLLGVLCVATGHVGECWLLNKSPLRHTWYWANAPRVNAFNAQTAAP